MDDRLRFETRADIDEGARADVGATLAQSLADATDLATQTKHAHWNVRGPQFQQLHELFDEQAELLFGHADALAERAAALGAMAPGTARMAAADSRIEEFPDATDEHDVVVALADRFAAHAANLRTDIDATLESGDAVTSDLYTELCREVDKQRWFLEAHLEGATVAQAAPQ